MASLLFDLFVGLIVTKSTDNRINISPESLFGETQQRQARSPALSEGQTKVSLPAPLNISNHHVCLVFSNIKVKSMNYGFSPDILRRGCK